MEARLYKFIVWLSVGLIIVFAGTSMLLTGKVSFDPFYDVGNVWEVNRTRFQGFYQEQYGHQEKTGEVFLDQGFYQYNYWDLDLKRNYNYYCIDIVKINGGPLQFDCEFIIEQDGQAVRSETVTIEAREGLNIVESPIGGFDDLNVRISGNPGASFLPESMTFRENVSPFNLAGMLKYALIIAVLYILCSFLLILACERNLSTWMRKNAAVPASYIVRVIDAVVDHAAAAAEKIPLSRKAKRLVRTFLFACMMVYSQYVDINYTYYTNFKRHLFVYSILILTISVFSLEDYQSKKKRNAALWAAWLILWIMASVADLTVLSRYKYAGIVMLIVFSVFYLAWGKMERKEEMIRDFMNGIHLYFVTCVLFCVLFRPETESIRYNGISTNPAITGLCMGTVAIMALGELENAFRNRTGLKVQVLFIIEALIALTFCWKAQGACPLLTFCVMGLVWFFRCLLYCCRHRCVGKFAAVLLLTVILVLPVYKTVDYSINTIPHIFDTEKVYEHDKIVEKEKYPALITAAYAAEDVPEQAPPDEKASRLAQKFSDLSLLKILNGRDYYYRTYLRNMNLRGHAKLAYMWGRQRLPHNAVIGIAHRYGVFAMVPYLVMIVAVFLNTCRASSGRKDNSVFPFYAVCAFIIMSQVDNIEQPFVWLPWFAMYILMGICFVSKDNENF